MAKKNVSIIICIFALLLCGFSGFYSWIMYTRPTLNNKNATRNTVILFNYLQKNYGKRVLSGQSIAVNPSGEAEIIHSVTGKYPAICSFDLSLLSSLPLSLNHDTTKLKNSVLDWARSGGIVATQWHWFSPSGMYNTDEYPWYKSFYSKATDFDVSNIFLPESEEYSLMLNDIDLIAEFLLTLQSYDIPVLFRPLHEAAGGWFWWGAAGREAYLELWHVMYDRLTNHHGVNNLIWVWNGESSDWYVGDDYTDIVSYDVYSDDAELFRQKSIASFARGEELSTDKMKALSESSTVPNLEDFLSGEAKWSYFALWCYGYIMENGAYSEKYTTKEALIEVYNHDKVITRDELGITLYKESQKME